MTGMNGVERIVVCGVCDERFATIAESMEHKHFKYIVAEAHEIRIGDVLVEFLGEYITNKLTVIDTWEANNNFPTIRVIGDGWSRVYDPTRLVYLDKG